MPPSGVKPSSLKSAEDLEPCPVSRTLTPGQKRWWTAFAGVCCVYLALALAFAYQGPDESPAGASGPVVIELAQFAGAGPEQTEQAESVAPEDSSDRSAEPQPEPQPETDSPPEPTPEPSTEPEAPVEPPPDPSAESPVEEALEEALERIPEDVSENVSEELPEKAPAEASSEPTEDAPADAEESNPSVRTAEQMQAAAAATDELSATLARERAAQVSWEGRLAAHLQRHKRYPHIARSRREEGVALVRFQLNREGELLEFELERSSGSVLLDREVRGLLRRAQPLPKPPKTVRGEVIELVLPIEFALN